MIDPIQPVESVVLATEILGVDVFVLAAVVLALLGVVGSAVPLVPGALLSLGGVYLYWWSTGYSDPGLVVLVALTLLGLLVLAVDWLGGALAATVGGASKPTIVAAGVAGFALFFVAGPLGVLAGVGGVVFLAELRRNGDPAASARTAAYTTAGMLASNVAQVLLTALLFLALLLVIAL
jgi:uncharacterized protein YqgC (DUF456 family)